MALQNKQMIVARVAQESSFAPFFFEKKFTGMQKDNMCHVHVLFSSLLAGLEPTT